MARTIQEIYDEIIAEKETFSSLDALVPNPDSSQTFLTDLTSSSKVAVWRLIAWLIAFAVFTHESLFDLFTAEVEEKAKEQIPGTLRWYVLTTKDFQLGYDLEWSDSLRKYAYSDTSSTEAVASKIITQASATDANSQVIIKTSKGDIGSLEKLTVSEVTAAKAYIAQLQFAGTNVLLETGDPDQLTVDYTIQYDPLVLDSNGKLLSDGSTSPVDVAITNFVQGLEFDGLFRLSDLTDAVQLAEGVSNAVLTKAEADSGTVTDIYADVNQVYIPRYGYLELNAASVISYASV